MKRIVAVLCLLGFPGIGGPVIAATGIDPAFFRRHTDEMRIKSPRKYQEMIRRAGGKVNNCAHCHVEVAEKARKGGQARHPVRP